MKKIIYSSLFILLLFTSCEDYLDVNNEQTNRAIFDDLTPKQMLSGAINNYTLHQVTTLNTLGNRLTYVWGLNSGFTATEPAYTYVFDSSNYQLCFDNTYLFGDNFQDILDKEQKFPKYSYHYGIAKVMKVICIDYATSLYGDVPYSEAFNDKISSPKYDDDKKIIPSLFAELDQARNYLKVASTEAEALGSEDIVFGGNTNDWLSFVNTIELRLLLRLSKTNDPSLVSLRNTRFAILNGNKDFISQDVTVNPGYNISALLQRSPVFRINGRNEGLNDWTSVNRANAAGDYIAKLLNGTLTNSDITADIVDPRRPRMFSLISGSVVGNVQGVFPLTAISRYAGFYTGRLGATGAEGDDNGSKRDAFLMLSAESKFLQSEAYQRGYLTGGIGAEQSFKDGITASFDFNNTTFGNAILAPLASTSSEYLTLTDSKNGLGWTGSSDKINAIMTQKYIALAQWQGIELYIDHLRTGFPKLPIPVGASFTNRPNRLIYPTSEYSSNSANVPNITNSEIFTVNSKTPYYLQ